MKSASDNPSSNVLGSGISEADLDKAINKSGYPLQLVVAQRLIDFGIQEEWSYIDPDTGTSRTIDLLASRILYDFKDSHPRVRPELHLLIECKQSDLPYVFFLSSNRILLPDFPIISGLKSHDVTITSDDDASSWHLSPIDLLELTNQPFLKNSVPLCTTFSKAVRKGNDITLSGSEPYESLVLPIIKASRYFESKQIPPPTAYYFDCQSVIGLAVLDAPMVGVTLTNSGCNVELVPWVRLVRRQSHHDQQKQDNHTKVYGIDIVHIDYLQLYIANHLLPFSAVFASQILKHPTVLAECRAFVSGMGKNSSTNIEPRLNPSTLRSTTSRLKATLTNIVSLASGRKKPYD
jgi:hypothetical protein